MLPPLNGTLPPMTTREVDYLWKDKPPTLMKETSDKNYSTPLTNYTNI
jgi:hypothetical protein